MIPLPPFDPALPGMATAFDGDVVAELLQTYLPDRADSRFEVTACHPHYVRYKPGTSCLVQYELSLLDRETAQTMTRPAHIRLYADDSGAHRWQSGSLRRHRDRSERLHPGFPRDRVAYLPAMRALVQVFPIDVELRPLTRAVSTTALQKMLHPALPCRCGRPGAEAPVLVRYKPGRKALLRVPMVDGTTDSVYVKLYEDDRGARLFDATVALRAAGVATPELLAYLPRFHMLVHAAAPGAPLASLRGAPGFGGWMAPAAETLSRYQGTTIPGLPPHPLAAEAAALTAASAAISRLLPDLAPRLDALLAGITARFGNIPDELVTSHGDFYDDQLLVSAGGVVLIDLDEARCAHPLLDVGNMLAHLTAAAGRGEVPPEAGDEFRDAYLRLRPASPAPIAVFEAAALLNLAVGPFRQLEPAWPHAVEQLVGLAEERLTGVRRRQVTPVGDQRNEARSGPRARRRPTPADPMLPQLAALADAARMAGELEAAFYGQPVSVSEIDVVRHKPGRRAILRYEVALSAQGAVCRERLYGKTFASERGPRTFRTVAALAAGRVFGPETRLPVPVGYLPRLNLMLQREVPGQPIASALLTGDTRLAERIAIALHCLHTSSVALEREHDLADELVPLGGRVERLAEARPTLAAPANRCLDLIERGSGQLWIWRRQPVHRDFYHDQLLIDGDRLAVLDLDDAARSEPAVDVANFTAHLRLLALQTGGCPEALVSVTAAFRRRSLELDPSLDPGLLRFLEGATLLRLAEIHAPRDDGARIAAHLLQMSEQDLTIAVAEPACGTRC